MRMERSWKRKKIPGLRCSSFKRAALADSGPTSVRVYVARGIGTAADAVSSDPSGRFAEPGVEFCADELEPGVAGGGR